MSLIINGMELPLPGDVMVCALIDDKLQCSIVTRNKPVEWCQALEIPTPHGRLIDADELFCKIDGIKGWDYGDESDMAISAAEALSAIDDSPTVIEAEANK